MAANYDPISGYYTDEARKVVQAGAAQLARFHDKLFNLFFSNGSDPLKIESVPKFNRKYEFRLVTGFSGSIGNPYADNSMDSIGEYNATDTPVAMTQQQWFGRVTLTQQEMQYFMSGSNDDLYWSEILLKRSAIAMSMAHQFSACAYGTGQYGKVAAVTTSLVVNSASTIFSLEVDDVQKMHVNFEFDALDSDGTTIARSTSNATRNLYGIVINNGNTTWGEGTQLVQFPKYDTAAYGVGTMTIPVGALICIRNMNVGASTSVASNNCFLSGLDEQIGNGNYPRNEGANVQVTVANYVQYTSFVHTYVAAVKASFKMIDGLITSIYARVSQSKNPIAVGNIVPENAQSAMFDEIERPMQNSLVILMHPFCRKALEYSVNGFGGAGQFYVNPFEMPKMVDPDMEVEQYKNSYIMCDSMCPLNRIFVIHPGSVIRCVEMQLGALPGDPLGGNFSRIPQTLNLEMMEGMIANFFAGRRDCSAKVVAPDGTSLGIGPDELLTA